MLDALTQRLSSVVKTLRGHSRLTEDNVQDMLREVRLALLDADAGVPVVKDFIGRVKEKALGQEVAASLSPGQALVGIVHQELVALMGGASVPLNFATTPPAIILARGPAGSGKTTSAGKLARLIKNTTKKKVLLVSTDVYRPAAIDQLATLAKSLDIELFPSDPSQKPVDIARAAVDYAKRHFHDVLIVDTAGRLAIDEAMMAEVRQLHAALNPIETLFVVDSMQGQDAVNVAKAFAQALPLTGIVLTKLDGDSRGGAALSVRHVTGAPIKFVGVSEKMEGLEAFHPERMASRILGMGDILSLVEEAHAKVDEKEAQEARRQVQEGQGLRPRGFQEPAAADEEDGRHRGVDRQAAGAAHADGAGVAGAAGEAAAAHRGHHQRDDARRAQEARAAEGLAQAAHRGRGGRAGAGGQRLLAQFEQMQR
jgi:signal recognition particle subunit SRP54